ncbi:hypothetical protein JN853_22150 [Pseudomonas syringae pv. actinidiae ICMP 9853]|nr:hypothetical protein JN853_22150 [Pseudomonas syringae pv. actinidiae ICMP 9853]
MPFWTLCVLFVALRVTASSVPSRQKSAFFQLSCDAPRRMPFWTLCVLCVALRVTASSVPSR